MPLVPEAPIRVSAYDWVPDFARGLVRDLRVRWALEEAGRDYAVRLIDVRAPRPAEYLALQPFGQVPTYEDGEGALFESGAIVLRIGEDCPALLPPDPAARRRATAWVFAALNSIEPPITELVTADLTGAGAAWVAERRAAVLARVETRLDQLAAWLGDRDYLEGSFTVGDLMMTTVLRILRTTDLVETRAPLAAYKARCEARPAFQRALADQLAAFEANPVAA